MIGRAEGSMTNINFFLFDGFESLDLFGPVAVLGRIESFALHYYSLHGEAVKSKQGARVVTQKVEEADTAGILVVPGGQGTRTVIHDDECIATLASLAQKAAFCLTVCTGSALLAGTGVLKGHKATSNKKAFAWVTTVDADVAWVKKARWVADGKFYSSSGVSAGIDMALGFVADRFGEEKAMDIANAIEYVWNPDKNNDLFVKNAA